MFQEDEDSQWVPSDKALWRPSFQALAIFDFIDFSLEEDHLYAKTLQRSNND